MQSQSTDFVAPLGQARSGRLVFLSGASRITLRADPAITDLARGHFSHNALSIEVEEGTLSLQYRHFACFDQTLFLRAPRGEIRLNTSIPWEIEFRKGVSHLTADLAQLQLRALDILGGADRIRLALSEPSGTAYIYASGGISQSAIRAPATAGIRVQISGGSSNLNFENQRFGAIGGETRLETPDFESAIGRYDICIAGGTSNLTIGRKE
jgi:hypothetical protein